MCKSKYNYIWKYGKICEKQQIKRKYAKNDTIWENMREFKKYAESHVPHLNITLAIHEYTVHKFTKNIINWALQYGKYDLSTDSHDFYHSAIKFGHYVLQSFNYIFFHLFI